MADDPSAFQFDVEYNGHRQSIRGRLRGNLVLMEPAAGEQTSGRAWAGTTFWIPLGATDAQAVQTRGVAASDGQPAPTTWPLPPWWRVPPSGQPE
jgi:hypothetical protein